jgi:hypothetical protein
MTSLAAGMTKPGGWFADLFWLSAPTAQGTASAVMNNETKNLPQGHEQGLSQAKDNRAGDLFGNGSKAVLLRLADADLNIFQVLQQTNKFGRVRFAKVMVDVKRMWRSSK